MNPRVQIPEVRSQVGQPSRLPFVRRLIGSCPPFAEGKGKAEAEMIYNYMHRHEADLYERCGRKKPVIPLRPTVPLQVMELTFFFTVKSRVL